jgi:hypothetical protein
MVVEERERREIRLVLKTMARASGRDCEIPFVLSYSRISSRPRGVMGGQRQLPPGSSLELDGTLLRRVRTSG